MLALSCYSSDENYNADFDIALVDLDERLHTLIRNRRSIFESAHAEDKNLFSMKFFDSMCFRSLADLQLWAEKNTKEDDAVIEIHPWLESLESGSSQEELPEGFEPPKDFDGHFRTEYVEMVLMEDSVKWETLPKNTSIVISTEKLYYKDLF